MAMICATCKADITESMKECPNCGKDDQKIIFVSTNYKVLKNIDGHCSTCGNSPVVGGNYCGNCNRISEPSREQAKDNSDQKECKLCGDPITGETEPNKAGYCGARCLSQYIQMNLMIEQEAFYKKANVLYKLKIEKLRKELKKPF